MQRTPASLPRSFAVAGVMPGAGTAVAQDNLPGTLRLSAVIRDFRAHGEAGGHPDFQRYAGSITVFLPPISALYD